MKINASLQKTDQGSCLGQNRKTRVLYILDSFPQLSQGYIHSEIKALKDAYEIKVVSRRMANFPSKFHFAYEILTKDRPIEQILAQFQPDVLHSHYATNIPFVSQIAEAAQIPYTIRTHSFDVLNHRTIFKDSDLCLGVLAFPFCRAILEAAGVPRGKVIDCFPVIDFDLFHNRSPNGDRILNLGACLPKKKFEDYINLAQLAPDKSFDLYPIGYNSDQIQIYNKSKGSLVRIYDPVELHEMPFIYKSHQWLIYTACFQLKSVGWPMAIAEAQAAGLGVCMPNIRPDLKHYLGSAGFLYNSISEIPRIISQQYPEELREIGFLQARKSDIRCHRVKLSQLWDSSL